MRRWQSTTSFQTSYGILLWILAGAVGAVGAAEAVEVGSGKLGDAGVD